MRLRFALGFLALGLVLGVLACWAIWAGHSQWAATIVLLILLGFLLLSLRAARQTHRMGSQLAVVTRDVRALKTLTRTAVQLSREQAAGSSALSSVELLVRAEAVRRESDHLATLEAVRRLGREMLSWSEAFEKQLAELQQTE